MVLVYQATNANNGKRYIGMTAKGLRRRVRGHKAQANAGNTSYFSRAVLKHGIEAFEFIVLAVCDLPEDALAREREMISALRPEYNTAAGGCSGPQGWKHSAESRERMRLSHIGQVGPWAGKKRSPESIAKRTATRALNPPRHWLGKKRPAETVAKIRATKLASPIPKQNPSPEVLAARLARMQAQTVAISRPVYCITEGKAFRSSQECATYYGVSRSALCRWLSGKSACQRGLKFEYVE